MAITLQDLQSAGNEQLLKLVARRHPDFADNVAHWTFLDLSYRGGRKWIEDNLFSYHKEGKAEFAERKKRAYRFPHSREVISLVNKYVFKGSIERSAEPPSPVKDFWKSATLLKRPIEDLMMNISTGTSTFGRLWVVVDNNVPAEVRTKADLKKSKGRTYAYFLKPTQVYDFEYDEDGELDWILYGEFSREAGSPLQSEGKIEHQYRIWTKEFTAILREDTTDGERRISLAPDSVREHNLGLVPVFPADHITTDDLYSSAGLIEDVAYLDRAVANYLSNLDVIIQDQTFSQLAIPFQGLMQSAENSSYDPDFDDLEQVDQMVKMGTKRVFAYNAEGGSAPTFISPDVKQADIIMKAVTKIVGEIYHSIGMAGERTKEDNAAGIDNSSGVAKAYDFEKLNAMLAAKARSLQNIEKNLIRLVFAWRSELKELEEIEDYVTYPSTFDVRNLADEMDNAQRMSVMNAPKKLRRMQMKRLATKMFPQSPEADMKAIEKEIDDDWLELDPAMALNQLPQGGELPTTGRVPGKKNSQGENNKGSVKAADKQKEVKPAK